MRDEFSAQRSSLIIAFNRYVAGIAVWHIGDVGDVYQDGLGVYAIVELGDFYIFMDETA